MGLKLRKCDNCGKRRFFMGDLFVSYGDGTGGIVCSGGMTVCRKCSRPGASVDPRKSPHEPYQYIQLSEEEQNRLSLQEKLKEFTIDRDMLTLNDWDEATALLDAGVEPKGIAEFLNEKAKEKRADEV